MILSSGEKFRTEFSQPKPYWYVAPMASAWCLTATMKPEEETEKQEPGRRLICRTSIVLELAPTIVVLSDP